MPRPRVDAEEIRNRMLDEAESVLAESSGRRLVLSDIANRMGKSQSYVHAHFRTKHDLVAALAYRWFAQVEDAVEQADQGPPEERIRHQIIATLRTKRAKFEEDPILYNAYLALAAEHPVIVREHVERLSNSLSRPIRLLVEEDRVSETQSLIEDATVQFRVPHMIALNPQRSTEERAHAVLDAVLDKISSRSKG